MPGRRRGPPGAAAPAVSRPAWRSRGPAAAERAGRRRRSAAEVVPAPRRAAWTGHRRPVTAGARPPTPAERAPIPAAAPGPAGKQASSEWSSPPVRTHCARPPARRAAGAHAPPTSPARAAPASRSRPTPLARGDPARVARPGRRERRSSRWRRPPRRPARAPGTAAAAPVGVHQDAAAAVGRPPRCEQRQPGRRPAEAARRRRRRRRRGRPSAAPAPGPRRSPERGDRDDDVPGRRRDRSPPTTARRPPGARLGEARGRSPTRPRQPTSPGRRPGRRAAPVGRPPIAAMSARFCAATLAPTSAPRGPLVAPVAPAHHGVGRGDHRRRRGVGRATAASSPGPTGIDRRRAARRGSGKIRAEQRRPRRRRPASARVRTLHGRPPVGPDLHGHGSVCHGRRAGPVQRPGSRTGHPRHRDVTRGGTRWSRPTS